MTSEMALGVAARCWTEPTTEQKGMDVALAKVFARRVNGYIDMLEAAWGIIANAGNGNWANERDDWQEAAARWRERYHDLLSRAGDPPSERVSR